MTPLTAKDRLRLVKTMALTDSPVAGEKLAALAAANRILAAAGLTWEALLQPPPVVRESQSSIWRQTCRDLLEHHSGSLRPWELGFVRGLPAFPRISTKQRYVLGEIVERVLGAQS
jgi:hypothetical protein